MTINSREALTELVFSLSWNLFSSMPISLLERKYDWRCLPLREKPELFGLVFSYWLFFLLLLCCCAIGVLHTTDLACSVPEAVGTYSNLAVLTIHESGVTGVMPESVCDLLQPAGNLSSLIADCREPNPNIICNCCTDCRRAAP